MLSKETWRGLRGPLMAHKSFQVPSRSDALSALEPKAASTKAHYRQCGMTSSIAVGLTAAAQLSQYSNNAQWVMQVTQDVACSKRSAI